MSPSHPTTTRATGRGPAADFRIQLLHEQVERLTRSAADRPDGRSFRLGVRWNADRTRVEYLYRHGQLICRAEYLDTVLDAFDRAGVVRPNAVHYGPVGIAILDVGDADAADLADSLASTLGADDIVTPNHVLDSQGFSQMCPATEPVPWTGPAAVLDEPDGPGHARVAVIDTGYLPSVAEQSGFERFTAVSAASDDDDLAFVDGTDILRPYGGHGTAATAQLLAAGNDSQDDPFWPAAFDWVTAVGGLTKNGESRAEWSNHGDWVDVTAPGDNVVVPYPNGTYHYQGSNLSADFTEGHAIWSGTSFSTPVVAGMIARRMIERNVDAPTARDIVLAEAAVAGLPATGPRVLA